MTHRYELIPDRPGKEDVVALCRLDRLQRSYEPRLAYTDEAYDFCEIQGMIQIAHAHLVLVAPPAAAGLSAIGSQSQAQQHHPDPVGEGRRRRREARNATRHTSVSFEQTAYESCIHELAIRLADGGRNVWRPSLADMIFRWESLCESGCFPPTNEPDRRNRHLVIALARGYNDF